MTPYNYSPHQNLVLMTNLCTWGYTCKILFPPECPLNIFEPLQLKTYLGFTCNKPKKLEAITIKCQRFNVKCLSWEQREQKHSCCGNVPGEGAAGFVMDRSSHWMASLYTNGPGDSAQHGGCAKEINPAPRGSGRRDLTNSLNHIQSSPGCLAGSSGQRVWSERTKPTP